MKPKRYLFSLLALPLTACTLWTQSPIEQPLSPSSFSQSAIHTTEPVIPPQIAAKLNTDSGSLQDQDLESFVAQEVERLTVSPRALGSDPEENEFRQLIQAGTQSPLQTNSPPDVFPIHTNPQFQPNTVEVFVDGEEIYPMIFDVLARAKQRIQVDLFVMGGDIGMKLARQLVERKRAGVEVLIMTDPGLGYVGPTKKQVAQVVRYLNTEGLRFKTYPLHHIATPPGILANRFQVDHDKLIVVDNETLIMGGMNFFDMAVTNRDTMFRIQGPLVKDVSQLMLLDWNLPPKRPTESFAVKATGSAARETAQMRLTKTDAFERSTKERILENIRKAQKSICIEMFEMSDPDLTQALLQAHGRGVNVRVLLDQKNANEKYTGLIPVPNNMPNVWPIQAFLKQGLPVRWFNPYRPKQELHRKVLLFDEQIVMAGSTNLTTQALTTFRETGFELVGSSVPARLHAVFEEDWQQHSLPIESLTLKQKLYARMVAYMDKRYLGWW